MMILRKALISVLIGAFLFNDIAFAADFQNLAPWKVEGTPEFHKRFELACEVVAGRYIDHYIKELGGFDKLKRVRPDSLLIGDEMTRISVASFPGLWTKFKIRTHIDLHIDPSGPVIFVDSGDYYNEMVIREAKRRISTAKSGPKDNRNMSVTGEKIPPAEADSAAGGVFQSGAPLKTLTEQINSAVDMDLLTWDDILRVFDFPDNVNCQEIPGFDELPSVYIIKIKSTDIALKFIIYEHVSREGGYMSVIKIDSGENALGSEKIIEYESWKTIWL